MLKKIFLTIPALFAGPAAVLLVFMFGYDWSVYGAGFTALIVSGRAIAQIWKRKNMDDPPTLNEVVSSSQYETAATAISKTYIGLFFVFCAIIAYLDSPVLGWWWAVIIIAGLFASSILFALPMTGLKLILATKVGISPLTIGGRIFYNFFDFSGYILLWLVTRYTINVLSA
jgi:hypothetical protein